MKVVDFAGFLRERNPKKSKWLFAGAFLIGCLQALILRELMAAVGEFASEGSISPFKYLFFAAAIVAYYLVYRAATEIGVNTAHEYIAQTRDAMTRDIAGAKYPGFLTLSRTVVSGTLASGTAMITECARFMPNCLAAMVLLAFSLVYAAAISGFGALVMLGLFGAVVAAYYFLERENRGKRQAFNAEEMRFTEGLDELFDGFIELKMNKAKRDVFLARLLSHSEQAEQHRREYERINMHGNCLYAILNYIPSGFIVFLVPHCVDIGTTDLVQLVALSMFATPALVNIAMFEPMTGATLDIIGNMETQVASLKRMEDAENDTQQPPAFEDRITIDNLYFTYRDEDSQTDSNDARGGAPVGDLGVFSLDVDGFELRKGEILFIMGGNGNGKSTLLSLIAGLREPQRKTPASPVCGIRVDGLQQYPGNMFNYRGLFSVVHSDPHVFSSLLEKSWDRERMREALRLVKLYENELDHVVDVDDEGRFTKNKFSSGQRKRMALACAVYEKSRPVLLLDEVAADFDPGFRGEFYESVLGKLKNEWGFTILAIIHDKEYDKKCDRRLSLRDGRLEESYSGS